MIKGEGNLSRVSDIYYCCYEDLVAFPETVLQQIQTIFPKSEIQLHTLILGQKLHLITAAPTEVNKHTLRIVV